MPIFYFSRTSTSDQPEKSKYRHHWQTYQHSERKIMYSLSAKRKIDIIGNDVCQYKLSSSYTAKCCYQPSRPGFHCVDVFSDFHEYGQNNDRTVNRITADYSQQCCNKRRIISIWNNEITQYYQNINNKCYNCRYCKFKLKPKGNISNHQYPGKNYCHTPAASSEPIVCQPAQHAVSDNCQACFASQIIHRLLIQYPPQHQFESIHIGFSLPSLFPVG